MKKFTAIIICLLMVFACNLAGCASFSIDKEKYYNEVLAKVGDTNITRFDLLNAYNSYGKTYFSVKGDDETAALNSTLDMLIERESLYQYALTQGDLYKPTAYQVNEVVKELCGEKIDIIPWSEDPLEFIAKALSPAKVLKVSALEGEKVARVVVPDDKLSLAIGKDGQNARLAARLTGWKIDVKSESKARLEDNSLTEVEGLGDEE